MRATVHLFLVCCFTVAVIYLLERITLRSWIVTILELLIVLVLAVWLLVDVFGLVTAP